MQKSRTGAPVSLLLLLVFFPFGNRAAQDSQASFEEIAAQVAAAKDANEILRAKDLYTQAVQLNPRWEDGWWSSGLLQYGTENYGVAADALSHLLDLRPDAGEARALRGL